MRPSLKTRIVTARFDETRAWYTRVFGLAIAQEWDEPNDRGVILAFPGGADEAFLEICRAAVTPDFSGVSLQFRIADIEGFRKSLGEDVPYAGPNKRPWGSTYLFLRDPNDIAVVVFEGGV